MMFVIDELCKTSVYYLLKKILSSEKIIGSLLFKVDSAIYINILRNFSENLYYCI